jgi:hypothetical protein
VSTRRARSRRPSRFRLTLVLRWRTSSASWSASRSLRLAAREQRRTLALELALDSSRLRQKELEQRLQMAQHRLSEMADSRAFREKPTQQLPQQPLPPQLLR